MYGVAIPTVSGLRLVLERLGAAGGRRKVLWHNQREEPVIYINGARAHLAPPRLAIALGRFQGGGPGLPQAAQAAQAATCSSEAVSLFPTGGPRALPCRQAVCGA